MSHVRRETFKTLLQRRTYFGWVGLFLVPFLITIAMRLSDADGGGPDQGPPFFVLIEANGIYVSLASLLVLSTFFLPLLASMSGSFTFAGEAENGTLRTLLMQPVKRGGLLVAKWFVANLYIAVGLVLLGAGALIAGGAVFGLKPMLLLTGQTVGIGRALTLIGSSYLYILAGMACVVSLALLFSTLTNSSLTAVAAALVLVIIMEVLGAFSVFDFLRPYLFTAHFDAWQNLLSDPIAWAPIRNGLANFAAWIGGTTLLAYLVFRRKDILS